jgi:hypothetical protein
LDKVLLINTTQKLLLQAKRILAKSANPKRSPQQ